VALVICGASTASALAQQQSEISAPSIEVLKLKWEKQIRLPRNFDPSIIPANRTFNDLSPRTSTSPADAVRTATQARNDASAATTSFPATPARLPVFYLYSMKVRNIGAKRIEGVAWDYLFIDSISNSKVGSHQFLSYEKVAPGKTVTFQRQMRSPPTRVVDASDKKGQRPKFIERAVIQCVLYADDTLWRSPQAREGVCDLLKKSKAVVKRKRTAA
jgi:hypothetical protein